MLDQAASGAPLAASSPGVSPLPPAPPPDRSSSNESRPSRWSDRHPLGRAARLALIGGAIVAAVGLDVPLCPFAIVTRHPCPGCGLTRATLELAHGHLGAALHFHPLAPVVAPIILAAMAYNALTYLTKGRWAAAEKLQGRWVTVGGVILFVAMMAVWIARFFGALGGPVPV